MTWFPDRQKIPEKTNVTSELDYLAYLDYILDPENRHAAKCEDLTFIIPVCIDSFTRLNNLNFCLIWILQNTNAKVMVHWVDDENIFQRLASANVLRFPEDPIDRMVKYGKEFNLMDPTQSELSGLMSALFITRAFQNEKWNPILNSLDLNSAMQLVNPGIDLNKANLKSIDKFTDDAEKRVSVTFEHKPKSEPFHRTKYLNEMLCRVTTKYVCIHDADIIYPSSMISRTMSLLEKDIASFCIPFAHMSQAPALVRVYVDDIGGGHKGNYQTVRSAFNACLTGDFSELNTKGICCEFGAGYGGSVFAVTEDYKAAGGEFEDFISWGAEDVERYTRFVKLGYAVSRVPEGKMYHLEHPRGIDSGDDNPFFRRNEELWKKLQQVNSDKLLSVMRNGTGKKYDWNVSFGPFIVDGGS